MNIIKINFTALLLCIMTITNAQNPFFKTSNTPHQTFPFNELKTEHFEPAIREGMCQHKNDIDAIVNNKANPNFENTILAYEKSGELLGKVNSVFGNLQSSETNDEMLLIAQKITPELSKHSNDIRLNEKLFARVKQIYDNIDGLNLNAEQKALTEKIYKGFVRSGANLSPSKRDEYRSLSEKLSMLSLQYSQNNLKETNEYKLVLNNIDQLKGLPEDVITAAAETAKENGIDGWLITLHAPSYIPFMQYAENRELRKELYLAYNTKCTSDNDYNNLKLVEEIANTRMAIAQLLGFKDFASYTLQERMAQDSESVYALLNQLVDAYMPMAQNELADIQTLAQTENGDGFTVMPWDWSFYSNKLKDKKFNLSEEMLRPYFELESVKKGVFGLATQLYGITFKKNTNIQTYHKDVDAYEVFDKDSKYLAVLYTDFHPRAGKRSGAWMSDYKGQWIDEKNGKNSRPHITLVMNFTKPTETKPALLSFDEFNTFLHEFGHGLHGIFANTTYESMSGTNVYRDFVELPSQILENYATEKEFLNSFAKHYETGEVIPNELINKIKDAENFNAAYQCLRQVSFGLLDMAWFTQTTPFQGDIRSFEQEAWEKAQLLPVVSESCMSTQFSHIFAGGYSAGYYSYKWAEVIDADAFALFQENGLFNKEIAESFRENILSKGGTEHPMILYKRFRGNEPSTDALLKRNGINIQ